jgi:hypothetical protein
MKTTSGRNGFFALWVILCIGNCAAAEKPKAAEWCNSLAPANPSAEELVLIDHERALYGIVMPDQAPSPEVKAAEELARWLGEMSQTGVTIPVARESEFKSAGQHFISVGRTRLLAEAGIASVKEPLGDEGYGIAVKGGNLYVWGGRTRGPVNAVFALLEEDMGCRWYTDKHFRIPKGERVTVRPAERTYQPPFMLRDPFLYRSFNAEWSLRNRTNSAIAAVSEDYGGHIDYGDYFVHTLARVLLNRDIYFKDHPDYYMVDEKGKRDSRQLCTTNPEVIRLVTEQVLEYLKNHPTVNIISVSMEDGSDKCVCPRCKALADKEGSHVASVLVLVNAVAEAVEKEYPHVMIDTLAYSQTIRPPKTMRPRKNVIVRMCNDAVGAWSKPFTPADQCEFGKIVKQWAAIHDNFYVWDYAINFNHYLIPTPNFEVVAQNLRFYADHHVHGVMTQANNGSPGADREWQRSWVFAKLMWNPRLDVSEVMRDFIYGHYGPAAEPIWKYNQLLEGQAVKYKDALAEPEGGIRFKIFSPYLNKDFLKESDKLFNQAEAAAASDSELLERVQLARLPLMYVQLMQSLENACEAFSPKMIDKFETIARRENMVEFSEGFGNLNEQIAIWRMQWQMYKKAKPNAVE